MAGVSAYSGFSDLAQTSVLGLKGLGFTACKRKFEVKLHGRCLCMFRML